MSGSRFESLRSLTPFSASGTKGGHSCIALSIDRAALRELVSEIVASLPTIDWPSDRVALTEAEAAAACGVGRHVLRDMRLRGLVKTCRLGKRIVYTRDSLMDALNSNRV